MTCLWTKMTDASPAVDGRYLVIVIGSEQPRMATYHRGEPRPWGDFCSNHSWEDRHIEYWMAVPEVPQ